MRIGKAAYVVCVCVLCRVAVDQSYSPENMLFTGRKTKKKRAGRDLYTSTSQLVNNFPESSQRDLGVRR